MNKTTSIASGDRIIETMIELAQCPKFHRIILAGPEGPHRLFELHRHGYRRVATTETCGLPRNQYDVALVEWQHSIKALATTLDWLVHFLTPASVAVIWINSSESPDRRKLGSILERLGFRIEAGTRCGNGLAISARRLEANQQAVVASVAA